MEYKMFIDKENMMVMAYITQNKKGKYGWRSPSLKSRFMYDGYISQIVFTYQGPLISHIKENNVDFEGLSDNIDGDLCLYCYFDDLAVKVDYKIEELNNEKKKK